MDREIVYNGIELSRFCAAISGSKSFGSAERDVEFDHVPGRNGDLSTDHGGYNNIDIPYHIGIRKPVAPNLDGLRQALYQNGGYHRLKDSWNPGVFRMAVYKGPFNPDVKVKMLLAELDVTFNCKPQKYLESGELPIECSDGGSLYNRYNEPALPLVRVYGTGYLSIGDETIRIKQADEYTDIDCELMDAYKDGVNCNSKIQCSSGEFFHLDPGENGITWTGDITRVIVTPRWWVV